MRRAAWFTGIVVFALLIPMLLMAGLLTVSSDQPSPSDTALEEIPAELIGVYQAAAATCEGFDWTVLAAIHKMESNFGTGPATSSKGAQGPMQFLPSTFSVYGVDGDGDGRVDIDNVVDAIFSSANLLCANGAGDPARLATAIWNYNHSQAYVNEVLTLAAAYGVIAAPAGIVYAATTDLLASPRVVLTPRARADLQAGVVDQRVVALLLWASEQHTIGVTVFKTGHSKYTRSGRVSLHYYGKAADVFFVDGEPVSSSNAPARHLVLEIAGIVGGLRPDELGHPFGAIGFAGGFSDTDHRDHVHIGYD